MPAPAIRGTNRELRDRRTWPGAVPQRTAGVFAVFSHRIKTQIDLRQPLQIIVKIP